MSSGNVIVLAEESELLRHRDRIFRLFEECFRRPIDPEEWEWLFLNNPTGSPVVALFVQEDRVLGHLALVPLAFTDGSRLLTAWRSGTNMVHPQTPQPGIMGLLGREAQRYATARGCDLTFGFPNDKSVVGHRRFLRWTVREDEYLIDVPGSAILDEPEEYRSPDSGVRLDTTDERQMAWRVDRPSVKYAVGPGLITSEYQGTTQILHLEPQGLAAISPRGIYRVYVHTPSPSSPHAQRYRYGYFTPEGSKTQMARPALLWSDVF